MTWLAIALKKTAIFSLVQLSIALFTKDAILYPIIGTKSSKKRVQR
jgi:hypothetical protein